MTKLLNPLPPLCVTFLLQIVNVIQPDLPPSYLDTVMIYSDFFFETVPKMIKLAKIKDVGFTGKIVFRSSQDFVAFSSQHHWNISAKCPSLGQTCITAKMKTLT